MTLPIGVLLRTPPVPIAAAAPLAAAHQAMRAGHVRHLVVLEAERLVGLVSLDDLHLLESLGDVDPTRVPVEEAMRRDPVTVAPDAPVAEVGAAMLARGTDAAVVLDRGRVAGVFTTADALAALVNMIEPTDRDLA